MPEHLNPCTRCNGSGTEPDPADAAFRELRSAIAGKVNGVLSSGDAQALIALADSAREKTAARITFLEAALRDILGRISGDLPGNETWLRVPNEDVRNWRKVLGDDPETRAGWSFDHELGGKA